jgi:hypothetical protein
MRLPVGGGVGKEIVDRGRVQQAVGEVVHDVVDGHHQGGQATALAVVGQALRRGAQSGGGDDQVVGAVAGTAQAGVLPRRRGRRGDRPAARRQVGDGRRSRPEADEETAGRVGGHRRRHAPGKQRRAEVVDRDVGAAEAADGHLGVGVAMQRQLVAHGAVAARIGDVEGVPGAGGAGERGAGAVGIDVHPDVVPIRGGGVRERGAQEHGDVAAAVDAARGLRAEADQHEGHVAGGAAVAAAGRHACP